MQRCPQCGREFERPFGDSQASLNCPECEARLAQVSRAGIPASGQILVTPSFLITTILIGLNALVFVVMVLRGVSPLLPSREQAIAFGARLRATEGLLLRNPAITACLQQIEEQWPLPVKADELFADDKMQSIADDLFLRCALTTAPLHRAPLEKLAGSGEMVVSDAARWNSTRASSKRPSLKRKSPRTLGNK